MIKDFTEYFEENKRLIIHVLLSSFITGFLSYYIYMRTGYGHTDIMVEGQYLYNSAGWHLELGRWFVRYFNALFGGGLVIPHLIVFLYCIFASVQALLIGRLFKISSYVEMMVITSLLVTSKGSIIQMTYGHVANTFAAASLLAILFIYCMLSKKIAINLLGSVLITISLGLYQTAVAEVAMLAIMMVIIRIIDGYDPTKEMMLLVKSAVWGAIGTVTDVIVFMLELTFRHQILSDRVASNGFSDFTHYFGTSIVNSYKYLYGFYTDQVFNRKVFYLIFLLLTAVSTVLILKKKLDNKKYLDIICILGLGLLIPIGCNLIGIMIPKGIVYAITQWHYILLIPFAFAIMNRLDFKFTKHIKLICWACMIIVISTLVINSNATFKCYELTYKTIENKLMLVMNDVCDIDGYIIDDTPVIFIGFPDNLGAINSLGIFGYSLDTITKPNLWSKWMKYLTMKGYVVIDTKFVEEKKYDSIVHDKLIDEMTIWPAKGSVMMINDCVVVKMQEDID